jgi:hypothetical protein
MGVGGQRHAPTALPPGKTRYSNPLVFMNNINEDYREIRERLQGNLLSFNYNKTYFF